MAFVHMIFLYLKPDLMQDPNSAETQHDLLLQPVCKVSSIELCGNLAVLGSIAHDVRVKKKYRDSAACQALDIILPCLDIHFPSLYLYSHPVGQQLHIPGGLPLICLFGLPAAIVYLLLEVTLSAQERHSNHREFQVSSRPYGIAGKHTEAAAV